jgi:hypothetical protein
MTPERKVKTKVTALLKELDVFYFFPLTGGYGSSGIPDIICCAEGRFFSIECKAGKGQLTSLQRAQMDKIEAAGGRTYVVNEASLPRFAAALQTFIRDLRERR